MHRCKQSVLFLKLDIAKTFDTVRWDLLMEVLQKLVWCKVERGYYSACFFLVGSVT